MRAGPSAAAETFLPMPLLVDCLSASSALRVLNDNALFKSTHSKSVYTLQPVKMHTFSDSAGSEQSHRSSPRTTATRTIPASTRHQRCSRLAVQPTLAFYCGFLSKPLNCGDPKHPEPLSTRNSAPENNAFWCVGRGNGSTDH